MRPTGYIANFDSAAAMLRANSRYLQGKGFPLMGMLPKWMTGPAKTYGAFINSLPTSLRDKVYIWAGWTEALPQRKLKHADMEQFWSWATQQYPRRKYPAIMVGSSNGANVHLCSAFGIPWLPQTVFMPVARHGVHPDEPMQDVEWSMKPARQLLDANPDLVLHHMHDPNQDRLMIHHMTYFRVKKLSLGPSYERFIRQSLEPGGTIFLVECTLKWPVTHVQDRHYFQFGALGGAETEEFHDGGPRVAKYLKRYESHRRQWHPPEPDCERPEAEWGFEPSLREDVLRFAKRHGYRVRRIVFEQPHDFSPLVADFYRQWNRERGVRGNRLLAESFVVHEPHLTIRTGSTPYWMVFNKKPSLEDLERYLDSGDPFDEIYLMLFSHGVESVGLATANDWRRAFERARKRGEFVGVDPQRFPRDFAVYARYHEAILKQIPSRYPIPAPLPLERLDAFLVQAGRKYRVKWAEELGTRRVAHRRARSKAGAE